MSTLQERLVTNLAMWRESAGAGLSERVRAAHLLGATYRGLGRWNEALALFQRMRDECAAAGDLAGVNDFDTFISNLYYHMGHYDRAIGLIRVVIAREREVSDECQAAATGAYYLAKPLFITDKLEEHRAVVTGAIKAFRMRRPPATEQRLPWFLCELVDNYRETGRAAEAETIAAEQIAAFRITGQEAGIPYALMVHGFAAVAARRPELAEASLDEALGMYRALGREGFVCDCLVGLSRTALAKGDIVTARTHAGEALREARLGPRRTEGLADTVHLNRVLVQVYATERSGGDEAEAAAALSEARQLAERHGRKLILRQIIEVEARGPGVHQA